MANNSRITNSGTTNDGKNSFVVKKEMPKIIKINSVFQNLLNKLSSFPLIGGIQNDELLSDMNDKISNYTHGYLNKIRETTGADVTRFLNKTLQEGGASRAMSLGIRSTDDLFNNDTANFGAFFFERYKNINNKYEDLRIITEYLYELEEAVTTMRDNIISADDLVTMISRELSFKNITDQESRSTEIDTIVSLEEKYKTKERLKNIIIPKLLTYGNFFVYSIPYKEVFAQFEYKKKYETSKGILRYGTREATESRDNYFSHPVLEALDVEQNIVNSKEGTGNKVFAPIIESLTTKYNDLVKDTDMKSVSKVDIEADVRNILEGIDICNDGMIPFMEDTNILSMSNSQVRDEAIKAYRDASKPKMTVPPFARDSGYASDSVVDTGEPDDESRNMYKDIPGVFIKLYSPERIIPIFIMDSVIGYYALYETYGEVRNSILLNSSLNRTNLAFAQTKKKELDDDVISVIADAICNSIDRKYVADNPQFRELIVNAISYQDFYRKKFKVQFIPVNYMTHFKINEDPDSHMGVSVLNKSLWYAKLYLSILLFKIITILTKSNDMRVFYIRNAGINKNMVNRVQEIARQLKDRQISFNDLASIQTIFSKVGTYKEAFIPMGKSGERNIEFEIVSGQDVQLNTELMEMLRKGMINNSGVPAVILSYMEEADFARTLTMQHTKYLSRIISLQTEIESSVTEWYKKLMTFDSDIDPDIIAQFKFSFSRPKALNAQDMSELISNAQQLTEFIATVLVGEEDQQLNTAIKKDLIQNFFLRGVFNWKEFEDMVDATKLKLKYNTKENEIIGANQNQ